MTGQEIVIVLFGLVHVLALGVLLWMLVRSGDGAPGLGWWFGWGQDEAPDQPAGPVVPGGAALPLSSSEPSAARLRGPERIADAHPRRQRRPGHAPMPSRAPDRS